MTPKRRRIFGDALAMTPHSTKYSNLFRRTCRNCSVLKNCISFPTDVGSRPFRPETRSKQSLATGGARDVRLSDRVGGEKLRKFEPKFCHFLSIFGRKIDRFLRKVFTFRALPPFSRAGKASKQLPRKQAGRIGRKTGRKPTFPTIFPPTAKCTGPALR